MPSASKLADKEPGDTAFVWTLAAGFDVEVIERVATVLVIACPHALGLAVPLVVAISTAPAANNGILVRNRSAMESARHLNTIIFDKTGTLTPLAAGVLVPLGIPAIGKASMKSGDPGEVIGDIVCSV